MAPPQADLALPVLPTPVLFGGGLAFFLKPLFPQECALGVLPFD